MNLRNSIPLAQGLKSFSVERAALLRVSEFLGVEELELSILIHESGDGDSIVFERGAVGGGEQE